jgi:hypothetical protein
VLNYLYGEKKKASQKYFAMYTLKKSFTFKNVIQAEAFVELTSLYGDIAVVGNSVVLEACLDFSMWRKIITLSHILTSGARPNIRVISSKAGLRLFKKTGI